MAVTRRKHLPAGDMRPVHGRRKHLSIDQAKLDRVVEIFGSKTESEAIDEALDLILLGDELNAGLDRLAAAGEITNYFDDHPAW